VIDVHFGDYMALVGLTQRLPARYYFCQPGVDLAKPKKIPQASDDAKWS